MSHHSYRLALKDFAMLNCTGPAIKVLPVIAMALLFINAAAAEDTVAPACLDALDNQEPGCCVHAHTSGVNGIGTFESMSTEMALTDVQKQQLAALLEMYRPRIKELAERGITSGQAIFDIAPDDTSYNARAAELSQLAGATAAEMVTLLTELQSNAYALLTDEQKAEFLEMRAEQRQRMAAKRASMQQRRESGDMTGAKGFGHDPGMHCTHMPTPTDNSDLSGATD
jgi:Spy/CpxP family protein refolding chaperone